jgi:hypothetical protein
MMDLLKQSVAQSKKERGGSKGKGERRKKAASKKKGGTKTATGS